MSRFMSVHWSTPLIIVSSLLLGALFALGHHLFYSSLKGTEVPSGEYNLIGYSVSKQQYNIAVGNVFAYLAKGGLSIAISTAYVQIVWRSIRRSKVGETLQTIDTTFSVIGNVFEFGRINMWFKRPLLLLLPVIFWLIPIASIVTPTTLTVQNQMQTPSSMKNVPQLSFTSLDYTAPLTWTTTNTTTGANTAHNSTTAQYCYEGSSTHTQRLISAVGAQGDILPITPPASNSTWLTDFWAPVMQCSNVSASERVAVWRNFYDYLGQPYPPDQTSPCFASFGYFAWVPSIEGSLPFANESGRLDLRSERLNYGAPTSFRIAVVPEMFYQSVTMSTHTVPGGCLLDEYNFDAQKTFFDSATLLDCRFNNASYTANFTYVNGLQHIDTKLNHVADNIIPQSCIAGPIPPGSPWNSPYFGNETADTDCSTLNIDGQACEFDVELVRTIAYQGAIDAFVELLQGTIGLDGAVFSAVNMSTNIGRTILMDTEDLAFVQKWQPAESLPDLSTVVNYANGSMLQGLSSQPTNGTRGSLASAVEDLFLNFTLSLMSDPYLQPNKSSPFAPQDQATVTITGFRNIYVYSATTLWIAYGLSVGFSTLAAIIGLLALYFNGAAYDGNPSTFMRVAQSVDLTAGTTMVNSDGRRPLPQQLKSARLQLYSRRHASEPKSPTEETIEMTATDGFEASQTHLLRNPTFNAEMNHSLADTTSRPSSLGPDDRISTDIVDQQEEREEARSSTLTPSLPEDSRRI